MFQHFRGRLSRLPSLRRSAANPFVGTTTQVNPILLLPTSPIPAPGFSSKSNLLPSTTDPADGAYMSKKARRRLLKQRLLEQVKAERRRQREGSVAATGVEKTRESRRGRIGRRPLDTGQEVVVDLEFTELMAGNEIRSLARQLALCYGLNGKCGKPARLVLTGCRGEIREQLRRLPGYDGWILDRDERSYVEVFGDRKEKLVYLTADSDTDLGRVDPERVYIIGGLVDRTQLKGVTLRKAREQGIETARLPISAYLRLSTSQVLTVNQVFEILVRFVETGEWKKTFLEVIPRRKRLGIQVDPGDAVAAADCRFEFSDDLHAAAE